MSRSFRYSLILFLVALGTGLAGVAGWRYARISSPVNGPIVLLSIEALRTDRLAAYATDRTPHKGPATPAIDGLAADGVLFERAYAHAPLTLPAHVSLLSGRLPFETGVRDNVGTVVPEATRLLSEMLRDRGYVTGGVVSTFALRNATGLAKGFAFFDDELPVERDHVPPAVHRDGGESEVRAERWLSAAATSRAFLFLHLADPHAPYTPPERYSTLAPYDGEVAYADEIVGRLVAYLKEQQLYEQATIILVGAQGESLGAHGEAEHGVLVFDDTIRVPLIIKPAAGEGRGRRVAALVQHVDIVPTVLDLARAPIPGGLAGRSLKPLLEGRDLPERVAYAESLFASNQFGWSPLTTVTDGRFRLVSGSERLLVDSEAPDASDVSAAHPETVVRLSAALGDFEPAEGAPPLGTTVPAAPPLAASLAPADRERFLALGSLGPRAFAQADRTAPAAPVDDPLTQVATIEAYRAAAGLVSSRRFSAALDRLRALAEAEPDVPARWATVAAVAERAERDDAAVDAWRRLVVADPPSVEAKVGLARALLRSRRLDEARRHAELAAQSADDVPRRTAAIELLARVAIARKDATAARAHAEQISAIDASSPVPAFVEGRLLLDRGQPEEATGRFDEAVSLVTSSARAPLEDLHRLRGEALSKLHRVEEAEDAYLTERRNFPDSTRARVDLATFYHVLDRRDEAAAVVTELTRDVATAEAFEAAARLWTVLGDRERAAGVRRQAQHALSAGTPRSAASGQ